MNQRSGSRARSLHIRGWLPRPAIVRRVLASPTAVLYPARGRRQKMRILRPTGVAPVHTEALRIACVSLCRIYAGFPRPASGYSKEV